MRKDVEAHNEFIAGFDIRVSHPDSHYDDVGFLHFRDRCLNPLRRRYYRAFNGNFSRGGRWFGPFWQGLPRAARKTLFIDVSPTTELDFRACHLRLLAAMARITLPFDDPAFDPFTILNLPRPIVKLAFNIMLNAQSERGALSALSNKLREHGWEPAYPLARRSMAALERRFPGLGPYWNTCIGLRLQNLDARICARVQRTLRHQGVPVLSIHDSFVVPQINSRLLQDVMNEEYWQHA
jgi:hypothetical protein